MLDYEFLYIISLPIYIILLTLWIIRKIKIWNILWYSVFYLYIIAFLAVTLFPIPIQWLEIIWKYRSQNNNFIPIHSISSILFDEHLYYTIKIKQLLWNIILFMPLWFFMSIVISKNIHYKKIFLISLIFALWIEFIQYIIWIILWFNYRSVDIDDVILNTLWWITGYIVYKIFIWSFKK